MNNELVGKLLRYEEIKVEMANLQEEAEVLLEDIMPHINEDTPKMEGEQGAFTVTVLPRYRYPEHVTAVRDAIKDSQAALKELEATARAEGDAELVENKISLVYTRARR